MRYPYASQEDFYLLKDMLSAGKILCRERKKAIKDLQSCDQVTQTVIDMYDYQINQAQTEKEREKLLMQKSIALKKCYDDFDAFEVAARDINGYFKQKKENYGMSISTYVYLDPNTPVDSIESSSDFTGMHAVVKPPLTEDFPFHKGILTVQLVAYTAQQELQPASLQVVAEMTVKTNHPDIVTVRDMTRPATFLIDYSNDSPNIIFENEPPF